MDFSSLLHKNRFAKTHNIAGNIFQQIVPAEIIHTTLLDLLSVFFF